MCWCACFVEFEDTLAGEYYECTHVTPHALRAVGAASASASASSSFSASAAATASASMPAVQWELVPTAQTRVRRLQRTHPAVTAIRKRVEVAHTHSNTCQTRTDLRQILGVRSAWFGSVVRARITAIEFPALKGAALALDNCYRLVYAGCSACSAELAPDANAVYRCAECPIPLEKQSGMCCAVLVLCWCCVVLCCAVLCSAVLWLL